MSREKEEDEKLYKVVKKRNSHINTKMNPDGSQDLYNRVKNTGVCRYKGQLIVENENNKMLRVLNIRHV